MYSYLMYENGRELEKHRAKGINRAAAKNVKHAEYKSQLELPMENTLKNNRIGNKLHQLYTMEVDDICNCVSFNQLPML